MPGGEATAQPSYMTPALERWRRLTEGPLLVVAIGTLPFLLLELKRDDLPPADRWLIDIVNIAVLVVFVVDYGVGLILSSDRRAYAKREWTSLLIVIAQALALLPGLAAFGALRSLRAVRGLRAAIAIARLVAIGGVAASQGRAYLRKRAASLALGAAGLTWLTAAVAFTLTEDVGEGHRVDSFFDALWWSTSTITTVGYGDIYPVTAAGRIVGAFTMLVGISTFAVVTAKVAEWLVRGDLQADADPEP